jgi:hypothetical protein
MVSDRSPPIANQIRSFVGPLERWVVSDVNAAIELARNFQRSGRYDLFRGQARLWPVNSGAVRLELEARKSHVEIFKNRLFDFHAWLTVTPDGADLAADPEWIEAAMQHYCGEHNEFKTYLVDFTEDPQIAGFFATENAKPGEAETGCIVCINSGMFETIWEMVADANPTKPRVEIVRPQVPDLWRLQAQKGVFVRAAVILEQLYELDRIVFPVGSAGAAIGRSRIYPDRRSRLEDLIDRYLACTAQEHVS